MNLMNMSPELFCARRMRCIGFGFILIGSAPVLANQEAHVHGEGHVNIAIEGDRIYLELESPGADIVGFEYAARTADETAVVARAISNLQDPMQMMRFDTAANCQVISATAGVDLEEAEHEEHDPHEDHKHDDDDHALSSNGASPEHSEANEGHSAYRAEYEIECADIGVLNSIEFTYFSHFPNAQTLDVVLIQDNGQQQQDVDRSSPVLLLNR